MTFKFEISINENGDDAPEYYYGNYGLTSYLQTGSCTNPITYGSCTAVAPFSTLTNSPSSFAPFVLTAPALLPVTITADGVPTTPVPQGFLIAPDASARPADTSGNDQGVLSQSSTITYLVDGVAVPQMRVSTPVAFSTAGLSVGTHTLQIVYSGNTVYASSTYTTTFKVGPPPIGTPYSCAVSPSLGNSYSLAAVANITVNPVPSSVPSGTSVPIDNLSVTLTSDPYWEGYPSVQLTEAYVRSVLAAQSPLRQ